MAKAAKKVLNDPKKVVAEMIDGLVLANDGRVRKLPKHNAIVRTDLPGHPVPSEFIPEILAQGGRAAGAGLLPFAPQWPGRTFAAGQRRAFGGRTQAATRYHRFACNGDGHQVQQPQRQHDFPGQRH